MSKKKKKDSWRKGCESQVNRKKDKINRFRNTFKIEREKSFNLYINRKSRDFKKCKINCMNKCQSQLSLT